MPVFGIAQLWCSSKDLGPNYDFGSKWAWYKREKSDFNEFNFWTHEPLINGKKNMPVFGIAQFWFSGYDLGLNYEFGSRWAWNRREQTDFNEFSFWAHEPLINGEKSMPVFGIAQFWFSG